MRILSINCGSSSIKCALIDSASGARLAEVLVEEVGRQAKLRRGGDDVPLEANTTFEQAARVALKEIQGAAERAGGIEAIAHRIVHGGERFVQPTRLDQEVVRELNALSQLAPLHNVPALSAVRVAMQLLPGLAHIAIFDTAFHVTLPTRSRQYALPKQVVEQFGIRRYGFHGTSHSHVCAAVAAYLHTKPQQLRIISCHLGNGASVTAIEYGRSVETSMGMTPLEGLVMGTRAGDLDPGVMLELMRSDQYDARTIDALLNKQSGLKGLTGTSDMREIEQRAAGGDEGCRLAITLYAHRVRKYLGAYAAVMGGVDVIAFTGGIGENSALIRHRCTQRLEFLGAVLDEDRNRDAKVNTSKPVVEISDRNSRTRLIVIKADEELAIAKQAADLLSRPDTVEALRIPVSVSARHAHLSQATIEALFGQGHQLQPRTMLSQTGQYAAQETVTLVGPKGRLAGVRLMGPPRGHDQIEISRTDEFVLGIDAPVRISGDLKNTPGITLEGPVGMTSIASGVITARRHIHMNPTDAARFGVRDHDTVEVLIDSEGRDLTFGDVTVRVSPEFTLEMHLDTDEANAAGIERGDRGELVERGEVSVVIGRRSKGERRTADGGR
jgi:acetate kinase